MKIEIPEPYSDGLCNYDCPFRDDGCSINAAKETKRKGARTSIPGPDCPGPGTYELIPEGEYGHALQANAMAAAGLKGAARTAQAIRATTTDEGITGLLDTLQESIDLALRDLAGMVEPTMLDKMIDLEGER